MCDCVKKATKMNSWLRKKEEAEAKHSFLWIFAVVGVIVAVAAIAYVVYNYISNKKQEMDEFEEFECSFDEDFMAADAE